MPQSFVHEARAPRGDGNPGGAVLLDCAGATHPYKEDP